jgi:hypothetical protein
VAALLEQTKKASTSYAIVNELKAEPARAKKKEAWHEMYRKKKER